MRKGAFLDRDGVINIDHGYVVSPQDFEFVDGIFEAAEKLHAANYALIVVTNQSGIGRGFYTVEQFDALTQSMCEAFRQNRTPLSGVYYCPHHPDALLPQYRTVCDCRKPAPGMILQAAKELDIDLDQSLMIGDKPSDMQAALAAGITHRILVGTDAKAEPQPTPATSIVARSALAALCGPAGFLLSDTAFE